MATYLSDGKQALGEVRTHPFDFTDDLRASVTVSSATATHVPPSGSASAITPTAASPYVYATLPAQTVAGVHILTVLATLSDGDKSEITITIVIPAAPTAIVGRAGLGYIRDMLRGMTDVTEHDWTIGRQNFFDDSQLDRVLDRYRKDIVQEALETSPIFGTASTWEYYDYVAPCGNLEQTAGGTSVFIVRDSTGSIMGTSLWTADYQRGIVTFTTDREGTAYYIDARTYDLSAAAADIWRQKASHYAMAYNITTDNHSLSRAQLYEHCKDMAQFYAVQAGPSVVQVTRGDVPEAESE